MLDRPRLIPLGYAALCAVAFTVVALLHVQGWEPLATLDARGRDLSAWAAGTAYLPEVLRFVEDATSTMLMTAYSVVLAAALLLKRHHRAALFVLGTMLVTALATTGLKAWIGRARPDWQDPIGMLENAAYPSGHASSTAAFAGVVAVLLLMLVRRSATRRLVYGLSVLMVLVVGVDRVLLGRHYPSDVVGGWLLAAVFVLLALSIYSPLPRSHAAKAEPLAEVLVPRHALHVILNPSKLEDVEALRAIVSAQAAAAGWDEPVWHYTTVEDSGTSMASAASVAGADLVLVCGGDGTVREVCAELAGTGIAVGIVPAGTGNLLARNLGLPLFLRSAVDVAMTGQDRAIDLVRVSGDGMDEDHFMVMAGMGFDAAIMEGVNEDLKARVGWVAYVLSGLKALMFPAIKVEISLDGGEPTTHRARTIVVGNVGTLQGGMPLLPDAAIDDGKLDVVLLHPRRFWSWIPLAWRVLARRPRTDETVNRLTGATVDIRASTDAPRQLDGDSVGLGHELHMECLHGKLLVRVPR